MNWMADAACRGLPTDLFYAEDPGGTARAKAICRTCPVIADCLTWALDTGDVYGVLGGTSPTSRLLAKWARGRKRRRTRRPTTTNPTRGANNP